MERFLQFNSTAGDGSPFSPSSSEGDTGRDAYEFVAFVSWYLFLILFCVVPTACAYRRRRLMERRLARQTYLQRMAANGLLFMGEGFMHVGAETEAMQMARMQRIETEIRTTTMTVAAKDLIKREEDGAGEPVPAERGSRAENATTPEVYQDEETGDGRTPDTTEMEFAADLELEHSALQLRSDVPNGNRLVPPACAICLCPYEVGDIVTHSPNEACKHAFHHECISTWLAKKPQSLCPCCRQEFCQVPPDTSDLPDIENNISSSGGTSTAEISNDDSPTSLDTTTNNTNLRT